MPIEKLLSGGASLVTIIGIAAFFVSVVVQLTKEFIPKKIPTKLYVLAVSLLTTIIGSIAVFQMKEVEIKFYLVVGSIAMSFLVAFVACNGWDEFKALKDRFIKK